MKKTNKKNILKGPKSSLTEFLRSEGITQHVRTRIEKGIGVKTVEVEDNVEFEAKDNDEIENSIILAARRKRRQEPEVDQGCVECGAEFEISVFNQYLREHGGYMCDDCGQKQTLKERLEVANENKMRRRRKMAAMAVLNRKTERIERLVDICALKLCDNITKLKMLDGVGEPICRRISKVLTKKRMLNDDTVRLFLNKEMKKLEFWDCSNVSSEMFNRIFLHCSKIERLRLYMCGQLDKSNLETIKTNLKTLRHMCLDGPFLINDDTWISFFEEMERQFIFFEIRNTHRFLYGSFQSLLRKNSSVLTSLSLSNLQGLSSSECYSLIPLYISPDLEYLEISYPVENSVSDEIMLKIFELCGSSLKYLNLDGCSDLTDVFFLKGLVKYCSNLNHLSLCFLDKLLDGAFATGFQNYLKVNLNSLTNVYLNKCINLGDKAILSLLKHSSSMIIELSLNSLNNLSYDFFVDVFDDTLINTKKTDFNTINFPFLTKLDISFVRSVNTDILNMIQKKCKKLEILEVFGDNRCSNFESKNENLIVIGVENNKI